MAPMTEEFARAAGRRGTNWVKQIPVLFGQYDDGDDAGQVVILGAGATPDLVKTVIPGTDRVFEVPCAFVTVGEDVMEQLQKVANHLRYKEWADKQVRPYQRCNPALH